VETRDKLLIDVPKVGLDTDKKGPGEIIDILGCTRQFARLS